MILSTIVTRQGHQVFTASNGREAWEIFQQESIPIVITDWLMPEMDGEELCRNIRSSLKDAYTYIIVATSINTKNDLVEILKSGVDDYILKPIHGAELNARIKTGERIIRLEDNYLTLQQTVIESRNKLRVLLDSLPEEIVSIDKNTCIVSANTAFLKDKGIHFNQAVGTPCFEARYWHLPLPVITHLKDHALDVFYSASSRFTTETVGSSGEPKRHFEFNMLPIRDDSGSVQQVVIVSKDISADLLRSEQIRSLNRELQNALNAVQSKNMELVETLEQLKETQSQMLQTEKMASIGQLAAGVAHEINNPVGFVSSNLKTLKDYLQDISQILSENQQLTALLQESDGGETVKAEMEALAARIRSNESELGIDYIMEDIPNLIQESRDGLDRIKKIVMDLKNFSHPGEDTLKLTDINQCLDSTLNIVWNELKYKASIVKDYSDMTEVKCYPQQLNQVFINILVNAAQAIEKQGEIRIATRQTGDQVEIAISDTGQGIPEKNLNRIFDPFFTTKPVGKGTGLGLNVSYNIIKKHEGTITVHSELGKGTTFIIRVPVNGPAERLSESV
jgi:signal transduction histidine kinase